MLEEGEVDPNGKFFYEELEEGNGGLWDRKIIIGERADMSPRYEEAREAIFWGEREKGKGGLMGI